MAIELDESGLPADHLFIRGGQSLTPPAPPVEESSTVAPAPTAQVEEPPAEVTPEPPKEESKTPEAPPAKSDAEFARMRLAKKEAEDEIIRQRQVAESAKAKLAEYEARILAAEDEDEVVSISDLVGKELTNNAIAEAQARIDLSQDTATKMFETIKNDFFTRAASPEIQTALPNFDKVIQTRGLENPTISSRIFNSPMGHELAYHLGSNPALVAELAVKPHDEIIYEMAKIELKLESAKTAVKTVSKAPPPNDTLVGGMGNSIKKSVDQTIDQIAADMRANNKKFY